MTPRELEKVLRELLAQPLPDDQLRERLEHLAADERSFSGFTAATRIIREEGFEVNTAKTRLMTHRTRQTVTNVVVNKVLGLSRQQRRRWRAMAHRLRTSGRPDDRARLEGRIAYLAMLNPQQASAVKARL